MKTTLLFNASECTPRIPWRSLFEQTRRLKGLLLKVPLVTSASITTEDGLAAVAFIRFVTRLVKRSGLLFTALYLKQCGVSLQRFYAGSGDMKAAMTVPVSLTRCGIPRLIPPVLRKHIRQRSERGDRLVQLYLSWFGLAKLIKLAPKVTRPTWSSLVDPHPDIESVYKVAQAVRKSFFLLQPLYLPFLHEVPLVKGISWVPTWKSTSTPYGLLMKWVHTASPQRARETELSTVRHPNIFNNWRLELRSFLGLLTMTSGQPWYRMTPGILWYPRVLYPLDYEGNEQAAEWDRVYFNNYPSYQLHSLQIIAFTPYAFRGRIGQVVEGGGKRRLFAICNYISQRLLHPVHTWAMDVLSRIPTDGTFDQERPLHLLRKLKRDKVFSFDLKSATDRFPVQVIQALQDEIWGEGIAWPMVSGSLTLNTFYLTPPLVKRFGVVNFRVGQPLGFYGSWPLFTLTHHYIVWIAALKAYPDSTEPFRDYALLGDDIVIADERVASEYRKLLDRMGVKISLPKSLISNNGSLEFAKRFWTKSMQVDLSPVSLRSLASSRHQVGLCALAQKYGVRNRNQLLRLAGAGYRVRARAPSFLSKRWKRLIVISEKPVASNEYPLELWLGRGSPLNPYVRAELIHFLRSRVRPKQLNPPPTGTYWDEEQEMVERTVLTGWMKQWLTWVSWYHITALNPEVSIAELLQVPMCSTSFQRKNFESERFTFGLLWKCYDKVAERDIGWVPTNLLPTPRVADGDREVE